MPNFNAVNYHEINSTPFFEVGVGSLISIQQTVSFNESGEGSLISIEQQVQSTGEGSLISIGQKVIDTTQATFFQKNGWDIFLYINGYAIPRSQIHGDIEILRRENEAAQMTFTLIPPRGLIDLNEYEGKSVILNIRTATGLHRAYTGKVNIPDLDLGSRKLMISCTDNRRELINGTLANTVRGIGFYSTNIFGEPADVTDELDKRLQTVPYSVNFDVYGYPRVASLFAEATPHYTFVESQVYRDNGRDPRVVITPRAKVVNTVNIEYEHRYQRMYKLQANCSWGTTIDCDFLTKGYSLTRRDLVIGAAQGAGWPIDGQVTCVTQFQSGFYNCGDITTGFSWIETGYTNVAKTESYRDPSGQLQTRPVTDSAGNQVNVATPTSYTDHSQEFCDGASWTSYYRFAQNCSESYTISVTAPQSVSRYGTVSEDDSAAVESTYDSSRWTDLAQKASVPNQVNVVGSLASSYYWNEFSNTGTAINDLYLLLYKARCTILKAHRENRVIFNTFLDPRIDTYHTVLLDTQSHEGTDVYAKGKVYEIVHTMNMEGGCNTKIELALSVTSGAASDTPLAPPARPTDSLVAPSYTIALGAIYGIDPSLLPNQTGFIGNAFVTDLVVGGSNTYRTQFPESMTVEMPKINETYTNALKLTTSESYTVSIVDDDLTVIL